MKTTSEELLKLMEKFSIENYPWKLSRSLFGDTGVDIYDFESYNYIYFLDNVKSLNGLLEGLRELSPLADDALEVAEGMNQKDFQNFKEALVYERRNEYSKISKKYTSLIMPIWFIYADPLSIDYQVPLGITLIRIIESEIDV